MYYDEYDRNERLGDHENRSPHHARLAYGHHNHELHGGGRYDASQGRDPSGDDERREDHNRRRDDDPYGEERRYHDRDEGYVSTGGYGRETGRQPLGGFQGDSYPPSRDEPYSRIEPEEGYGSHGRPAGGRGNAETYTEYRSPNQAERREVDLYGGESGTYNASKSPREGYYGSGVGSGSEDTYVVGSQEKWQPGQKMSFPASEAKAEENLYAKSATEAAADTRNLFRDGAKHLENWAMNEVKDLLSGDKKHGQ